MDPVPNTVSCIFVGTDGEVCTLPVECDELCYWHSSKTDKRDAEVRDKLEAIARSGRSMEGYALHYADLSGINLVNRGSKVGYNLSNADLYHTNLENAHLFLLNLSGSSLMKANLVRANLHRVDLRNTNLLGIVIDNAKLEMIELGTRLVQETQAKAASDAGNPNLAKELFQQSEEIYRNLRSTCTRQGLFEHAGEYFHREMVMRRKQKPLLSPGRLLSLCVDAFCGYGEKPRRVIVFSLTLVALFAMAYSVIGLEDQGNFISLRTDASTQENLETLYNCVYFSVVTFTTLGYGDIVPTGAARILAATQAFMGSFIMALFVVVFVNKVTR